MSNKRIVVRSGGVGFSGLLGILFIALKLTGAVDWPWLWVLAPLWVPLALVCGVAVIGAAVWVVAAIAAGPWGADRGRQ